MPAHPRDELTGTRCWIGPLDELHAVDLRRKKILFISMITLHSLLLACYTFPRAWVPEKLRVIGQFYARPLFHQQWLLFAPDPPMCSCGLEAKWGTRPWASIDRGPSGYLKRRTVQALARHVQSEVHAGDTIPAKELVHAMRAMALYSEFEPGEGRSLPRVEFRLVESCATDPGRPAQREERVTHLHVP